MHFTLDNRGLRNKIYLLQAMHGMARQRGNGLVVYFDPTDIRGVVATSRPSSLLSVCRPRLILCCPNIRCYWLTDDSNSRLLVTQIVYSIARRTSPGGSSRCGSPPARGPLPPPSLSPHKALGPCISFLEPFQRMHRHSTQRAACEGCCRSPGCWASFS